MIPQLLLAAMLGALFGFGLAACLAVAGRADEDSAILHDACQWQGLCAELIRRGWQHVTPDLVAGLLPSVAHGKGHRANEEDA